MTRAEFADFGRATFNAMDMITPAEGATAVVKAFDELDTALRACAEALAPSSTDTGQDALTPAEATFVHAVRRDALQRFGHEGQARVLAALRETP